MLQRTLTTLVTSALLGAVLLIAPAPTAAASGTFTASTISAGDEHTCALDASGSAWCWGDNSSYNGELGDGLARPGFQSRPQAVAGGLKFTSISATGDHTCAITSTGAAYCWGENDNGELGDETTENKFTPTAVTGGLRFLMISSGDDHTCGITLTGATYCWGRNDYGQLGNGTYDDSDAAGPQAVAGGLQFTAVNAGNEHTCAITSAGAAYCWGGNGYGELGDGTFGTDRLTPTAVSGGLKFTSVDAGDWTTCALTSAGAAYCWGADWAGSRGTGGYGPATMPQAVIGGLKFISISTGDDHTCALTSAGAAYCWGENGTGELGDGTTNGSNAAGPRAVRGNLVFVTVIANAHSGGNWSCGITTAGDAYCWGNNGYGALGDGSFRSSLNGGPRLVTGGHRWALGPNASICDRSSRGRERCRPTR